MERTIERYDRAVSHVNRRRVLAGAGTLVAGGLGVVALPEDVRAAVSVDDLEIPDASFDAEEVDPELVVDLDYEYDVGEKPVSDLGFTLAVDGTVIAEESLSTGNSEFEGEETLSGKVVDADDWSAEDFAPNVADSVERELVVSVTFDVLDSDGESIVSASESETVLVSVEHPQETEYTASVGGRGDVVDASE